MLQNANRDPDQMLHSAASDLGLHCLPIYMSHKKDTKCIWESSGSVVECLTRDPGAAGLSLSSITALCPYWKTRPYITEKLLMGRKESNQTNKTKTRCIWVKSFCSKPIVQYKPRKNSSEVYRQRINNLNKRL